MNMFGWQRREHRLIAQTPLTLAALTRHAVRPEEEQWFARCRADFLRSFPISLLECARFGILACLVAARATTAYFAFVAAAWAVALLAQVFLRRMEARHDGDERRALAWRGRTIVLRAALWATALAWAALIAAPDARGGLTGLAVTMMVVDGISAITLPYLALGAAILQGLCLSFGLVMADRLAAVPTIAIMVVTASFLHWSIFNLYYMFATRRIRTKHLSQSNETIRLVLNQYDDEGSDWLYEVDSAGCIVNPSQRFSAAAGRAGNIAGKRLADLFRDGDGTSELKERLAARQSFRTLPVSLTVDGKERWWSISGRPVHSPAGQFAGWRGFIADVTEAKRSEERVAWLAHYDALTGLANRALLQANLDRRFSGNGDGANFTLLYIDLDRFKEVNDGLGHDAGDSVLVEVARRLEQIVRPRDLVARLGGDEFVILAADTGRAAARAMAERVLASVAEPIHIDGQVAQVGASIGIAMAHMDAADGADLLHAADVAMYNAKTAGRQTIALFEPEMETQLRERRKLELDLRTAVRDGHLELYYQPLLDIATGETTGYEALLRWNHPELGMVQPTAFIPIAEETGIIAEIGRWVIRAALSEAASWPTDLSLAVNLSPVQMRDSQLLGTIINALASSGVAPQRLELEITETMLMHDTEEVMAFLYKLRELGVRIALDDFGTGYSSLSYLRAFPFDKIKIDRCFITELSVREDCQAIVRSILALAAELRMTTTAEGVEDVHQLEALRASGCDQVQGHLFSKALPASEIDHRKIRPDDSATPAAALSGSETSGRRRQSRR